MSSGTTRVLLIVAVLCAVGAGCYGLSLINWSNVLSCPKGQHSQYVTSVPIIMDTGKMTYVVMDPIYDCENNA